MKRLLIITNILWLLAFVFVFFRCCQKETVADSCNTIKSNYTEVTERYGRLSLSEAKEMANLYYKNRYPFRNDSINEYLNATEKKDMDARSVWFSLETLKQFLWDIESEAATCKKGCESINLGVRIYYAEYPELEAGETEFPANEKKKMTLFMVPTYAKKDTNGNAVDFDFNPRHTSFEGKGSACEPITLQELVELKETKKTAQNNNEVKASFAQFSLPIETILEDKFILSPHPKSLVKPIAAENMPPIRERKKDPKNPRDDPKKDDKNKPTKAAINNPRKIRFNAFVPTPPPGDYMFQNHGALCPINCNENGDDYFTEN